MKTYSKNGFTLVELLVVIAIIGMLSAALIVYVPGALDAGRAVKCKANLKNLGQAVSSYAINSRSYDDDVHLPTAGSFEWTSVDMNNKERDILFHSSGAWVCWTTSSQWPYSSTESWRDRMTPSTFFDQSRTDNNSKAFYSITNGVLWSYLGKDANVYVCETHKKEFESQKPGFRVRRSYVMNRYFGFDDRYVPPGKKSPDYDRWVRVDDVARSGTAAIRALFVELPGQLGTTIDTSTASADSVLDPNNNEYLGFNHKVGKKWIAHVVFADGHVDGLVEPLGAAAEDLKDLTTQLCNGSEIDAKIRVKMQ
jgi:prepilin-type N-terminal cleavage/methylation domain-containing protein/prepilin-type processing-associated H-X9-DG protein